MKQRWTGLVDVFGSDYCEDTFPVLFNLYEQVVLGEQEDNLELAEIMFDQWERELSGEGDFDEDIR